MNRQKGSIDRSSIDRHSWIDRSIKQVSAQNFLTVMGFSIFTPPNHITTSQTPQMSIIIMNQHYYTSLNVQDLSKHHRLSISWIKSH